MLHSWWLRSLIIICMVWIPSSLWAQSQGVDLNQFHPPVDNLGFLQTDSTALYSQWGMGGAVHTQFAYGLLELNRRITNTQKTETIDLLGSQLRMDMQYAIAFWKYYQLGLEFPVALFQDGEGFLNHDDPAVSGVGDLRIHNKFRILDRTQSPVGVGFITTLILPTGDDESWLSDGGFGTEFKLLVDTEPLDWLLLGINFGYRLRSGDTILGSQKVDDELLYSAAVRFKPSDHWNLYIDIGGASLATEPFKKSFNNPIMADGGFRYDFDFGLSLLTGVGTRVTYGYGAPLARGYFTIAYTYSDNDRDNDGVDDYEDQCPSKPEDRDGNQDEDGCPDTDNDGDGILDTDDRCPDDVEDFDDFEDWDGCPEPDNDRDGILDEIDNCPLSAEDTAGETDGCPNPDVDRDGIPNDKDQCPYEPEDKEGFQDEDGCPDFDNDGDGIPDVVDLCPYYKEDPDAYFDEDGCEDADNDYDGVPDKDDKCPLEREVYNDFEDADGCPDSGGEVLVRVHEEGFLVKKRIRFEEKDGEEVLSEKILPVLDQMANVIRSYPQILLIEVQSHSDNGQSLEKQKDLTQQRANKVADYLMSKGVDAKILKPRGVGNLKPLVPGRDKNPRNDRVEFKILKTKSSKNGKKKGRK